MNCSRPLFSTLSLAVAVTLSCPALGQPATSTPTAPPAMTSAGLSQEDMLNAAVDAYLYLYPLVTMDVTRRQMTNLEAGKKPGFAPMNTFAHVREYPPADMKTVVRPNFDTLYSVAWVDVSKEPMVVSLPDTAGRYYLLPILDMWTDAFAVPGKRTTGTEAGRYAIVMRGWSGTLPDGVVRIDAPTPYVWIIGRTQTNGPEDYAAVHKVQDGMALTPLSQLGKPAATPAAFTPDPTVDMHTPPLDQVNGMSAQKYFTYGLSLMGTHPAHTVDWSMTARMKRLGLVPGKALDWDKLDPALKMALEKAPAEGLKLMKWKMPSLARITNGWTMNTDTMGVYGDFYLKRAVVAMAGLGANQPMDAIYPMLVADAEGKPLTGEHKYVLHFSKDDLPPVNAFWSVTMYDDQGFQVANKLNRFAISSWMPLKRNPDGSLDLYIQNASPGPERESNWLPAPTGPNSVVMRLYGPRPEALDGRWNPPAVKRVD